MTEEEYEKITWIIHPNNQPSEEQTIYEKKKGFSFRLVEENGEMAKIAWIGVYKDDNKIAQIKQSVCNIYFN